MKFLRESVAILLIIPGLILYGYFGFVFLMQNQNNIRNDFRCEWATSESPCLPIGTPMYYSYWKIGIIGMSVIIALYLVRNIQGNLFKKSIYLVGILVIGISLWMLVAGFFGVYPYSWGL